MGNFIPNTKISRVANAAAAGTADVVSSVIDMAGFDGVTFAALLGDVTVGSELQLIVEHGDAADGSDAVATEAATAEHVAGAADTDNKILAVEAFRPVKRYVRARLKRATANAVVDGIMAIQAKPQSAPTTHDAATVLASAFKLHPETA